MLSDSAFNANQNNRQRQMWDLLSVGVFLITYKKTLIINLVIVWSSVNMNFECKSVTLCLLQLCFKSLPALIFPSGQAHNTGRAFPVVAASHSLYCGEDFIATAGINSDCTKRNSNTTHPRLMHIHALSPSVFLCNAFYASNKAADLTTKLHTAQKGEERWQLLVS